MSENTRRSAKCPNCGENVRVDQEVRASVETAPIGTGELIERLRFNGYVVDTQFPTLEKPYCEMFLGKDGHGWWSKQKQHKTQAEALEDVLEQAKVDIESLKK